MIIINTSHILPDTPYLLDGTESSDVLELPADADPPLSPAGDITYHLGLTGLISLLTKGLSRLFSSISV